ncbi:MAG: hypothetical protein WAV90_26525 [Gordonia amarae]
MATALAARFGHPWPIRGPALLLGFVSGDTNVGLDAKRLMELAGYDVMLGRPARIGSRTMKPCGAIFVVLSVLASAGCAHDSTENASTTPPTPTISGQDASVIAQVDCGEDGVANVHIQWGVVDKHVLVGRNPTTKLAGGIDRLQSNYAISPGYSNALFTITTRPTTGTCTTSITDYEAGEVVAEKASAGQVILKAVLAGDAS